MIDTDMEPLQILTDRLFPVNPNVLFDAFADPEKLRHWWGPDGFSNTIHEFDFRPGGSWHYTMHASDGTDFVNHSTFQRISPGREITFIHHLPMHVFTMEMTFSPVDAGCQLTWRMLFEDSEENRALEVFIAAANQQNYDRLHDFLTHNSKGAENGI